jgi:hypothetical protein
VRVADTRARGMFALGYIIAVHRAGCGRREDAARTCGASARGQVHRAKRGHSSRALLGHARAVETHRYPLLRNANAITDQSGTAPCSLENSLKGNKPRKIISVSVCGAGGEVCYIYMSFKTVHMQYKIICTHMCVSFVQTQRELSFVLERLIS